MLEIKNKTPAAQWKLEKIHINPASLKNNDKTKAPIKIVSSFGLTNVTATNKGKAIEKNITDQYKDVDSSFFVVSWVTAIKLLTARDAEICCPSEWLELLIAIYELPI